MLFDPTGCLKSIDHSYHMADCSSPRQQVRGDHMSPYEYFLAGYWDPALLSCQTTNRRVTSPSASHIIPRIGQMVITAQSLYSSLTCPFGHIRAISLVTSRGQREATHHSICLPNWSNSSSSRESLLVRTFCGLVLVWKLASLEERRLTLCGKHSLGQTLHNISS